MNTQIIDLSSGMSDKIDYENIVFKIDGDDVFDLGNHRFFLVYLKTLIAGWAKKIINDLNDLLFIDSAGIGVIINGAKLIRAKKGDIVLLSVPEKIEKIFKPIHLDRFLNSFKDEKEALNFFRVFS